MDVDTSPSLLLVTEIVPSVSSTSSQENRSTSSPVVVNNPSVPPPIVVDSTDILGLGKREKDKSVLLETYVTYSALSINDPSHSPLLSTTGLSGTTYHIAYHLSSHHFSAAYCVFLAAITTVAEPTSFSEAMKHDVWTDAIGVEIYAHEDQGTWDITDLPPVRKLLVVNGCIRSNSTPTVTLNGIRLS